MGRVGFLYLWIYWNLTFSKGLKIISMILREELDY